MKNHLSEIQKLNTEMDSKYGEMKNKQKDIVEKRNGRKCQNYLRKEEYITRYPRENRD